MRLRCYPSVCGRGLWAIEYKTDSILATGVTLRALLKSLIANIRFLLRETDSASLPARGRSALYRARGAVRARRDRPVNDAGET